MPTTNNNLKIQEQGGHAGLRTRIYLNEMVASTTLALYQGNTIEEEQRNATSAMFPTSQAGGARRIGRFQHHPVAGSLMRLLSLADNANEAREGSWRLNFFSLISFHACMHVCRAAALRLGCSSGGRLQPVEIVSGPKCPGCHPK